MVIYLDHNPERGITRNSIARTSLKLVSTQELPSGMWKVEIEE